jgi:adenine-specific DNA-methyltransferase
MVQLPEVCDEKSEAYKAGYKNISELEKNISAEQGRRY